MSSDKRALRLGPAIRTKASSVMSLREAPRSSRRSCRDAYHKDQLKASAVIDENPKKNRSMSSWERNGDGLKKLESLCSSPECSENDSRSEDYECEEDDQRDKDTRRLLLREQSDERVPEVNQRDTPTVRASLLDPIIACVDEATPSEGQSIDAVDDNDDDIDNMDHCNDDVNSGEYVIDDLRDERSKRRENELYVESGAAHSSKSALDVASQGDLAF